jgi:hypothetical protein
MFCQNQCTTITVEKVAKTFGLFPYFFYKLPQENARPTSEKSPNLVTLLTRESFDKITLQGAFSLEMHFSEKNWSKIEAISSRRKLRKKLNKSAKRHLGEINKC